MEKVRQTLLLSSILARAPPNRSMTVLSFQFGRSSASVSFTTHYASSGRILDYSNGIITRRVMSSTRANDFEPIPPPGTHGTPVFEDIAMTGAVQDDLESWKRNNDASAIFVVTGASRGIGLQFVKSLLERTKGKVVACCRSPETAQQLAEVRAMWSTNRVDVVSLDLEQQSSIEEAGAYLRQKYTRVDGLFNVAGILGDGGKTTPGPERSISKIDRSWFEKSMAVNVIGPVMLTKEVSPLLMTRKQRQKKSSSYDQNDARPTAVVVNLSARVGSISDNGLGGWYSYRMSKSALNQATRTMALEMKRQSCWAVALHPGTTDTDLSVPFQANVKEGSLFPVHFTVERLLDLVDYLEEKHSGGFYDWSGQALSF